MPSAVYFLEKNGLFVFVSLWLTNCHLTYRKLVFFLLKYICLFSSFFMPLCKQSDGTKFLEFFFYAHAEACSKNNLFFYSGSFVGCPLKRFTFIFFIYCSVQVVKNCFVLQWYF